MKKHERKFSGALGLLGFILIGLILIFLIKILAQSNNSLKIDKSSVLENRAKMYTSKNLKFRIEVPEDFTITEEPGTVKIVNTKGEIYIDTSGTNFETINEYVEDLNKKNNSTIDNKEDLKINNLAAIRGVINKKSYYYFIYAGQWRIFTLFTDVEVLNNDLDQIAQSFRYVE